MRQEDDDGLDPIPTDDIWGGDDGDDSITGIETDEEYRDAGDPGERRG